MDSENKFEVKVSNKNIVLVTMKRSDKRDGYLLRLINNYQEAQNSSLTVGTDTKTVHFGKYEVKTFFYDGTLTELENMEIQIL